MSAYIEYLGGYIADTPNIYFERHDGKVFACTKVNTANVNYSRDQIVINGGHRNLPLATILSSQKLQLSFQSSEFSMNIFEISNGQDIHKEDSTSVLQSKRCAVGVGRKIHLPFIVEQGSIYISGMTYVTQDTPGQNEFTVQHLDNKTIIHIGSMHVKAGDMIRVACKKIVCNAYIVAQKTTSRQTTGALTFQYPVMSGSRSKKECILSGYLRVYVPKVRVSQSTGIQTGYKTQATFGLTFTAMQPKKGKKLAFQVSYEDFIHPSVPRPKITFMMNSDGCQNVIMPNGTGMRYIPEFQMDVDKILSVVTSGINDAYNLNLNKELIWTGQKEIGPDEEDE